jgi:hypothetical protein
MSPWLVEDLDEHADVVASLVTKRMARLRPDLFDTYRQNLRNPSKTPEEWCTEDTVHHLGFLSAALTSSAEVFIEYREWLVRVLTARGIPMEDIDVNFSAIAMVLEERYGSEEAQEAKGILERSRRHTDG